MERIKVSEDIYLYRFEKALGHFIGLNVILIQNKNEALLIDTGYEDNFLELKSELDENNIIITNLVVSHYHPDHTGGLKHLRKVNIYGSENANNTINEFNGRVDHILPTHVVNDELSFKFGSHSILLEKNEGHSVDGLLVTIDNKYLFVADDMVFSHKGKALVPFCAEGNLGNHILSIEKIKERALNKVIIPTHGEILYDQGLIKEDLNNRLIYLNYLIDHPNCIFEDFIKDTGIKFIGKKSHIYNTKKEVKKW